MRAKMEALIGLALAIAGAFVVGFYLGVLWMAFRLGWTVAMWVFGR